MNVDILLCGMILGFKIQRLEIMPIGFAVTFKIDTKNYNKKIIKANLLAVKKIGIAIAGPAVNFLFIMIFCILEKIFFINLSVLIYVNMIIFLFNMFIIYPLDGGRILKNVLYIFLGKIKSLIITKITSNILASILTILSFTIILYTKNISYIFVVIYIWVIVIKENKIINMKIKMYKILKNYIAINQD